MKRAVSSAVRASVSTMGPTSQRSRAPGSAAAYSRRTLAQKRSAAAVQTAAALGSDITVRGGSLVFSGRTCTNEWYRFKFNGLHTI